MNTYFKWLGVGLVALSIFKMILMLIGGDGSSDYSVGQLVGNTFLLLIGSLLFYKYREA